MGHTDKQRTLVPMLEQHRTTLEASTLYQPNAALPYLQLIPATDGLQNPVPAADLLQSPQWNELLAWARRSYDAVVIDTTALDQYPDTLPLLLQADSDYFVFTTENSTKQAVAQLKTLVDAQQTRDLHLILNVSNRES
jgi:Mrp family chromosome partitioning ATPase